MYIIDAYLEADEEDNGDLNFIEDKGLKLKKTAIINKVNDLRRLYLSLKAKKKNPYADIYIKNEITDRFLEITNNEMFNCIEKVNSFLKEEEKNNYNQEKGYNLFYNKYKVVNEKKKDPIKEEIVKPKVFYNFEETFNFKEVKEYEMPLKEKLFLTLKDKKIKNNPNIFNILKYVGINLNDYQTKLFNYLLTISCFDEEKGKAVSELIKEKKLND